MVQSRFLNELKIIKMKNPERPLGQLIRYLFHGTRQTDPLVIATGEAGLDMRYSNFGGAYGSGIYFADNAAYSHTYSYVCPKT